MLMINLVGNAQQLMTLFPKYRPNKGHKGMLVFGDVYNGIHRLLVEKSILDDSETRIRRDNKHEIVHKIQEGVYTLRLEQNKLGGIDFVVCVPPKKKHTMPLRQIRIETDGINAVIFTDPVLTEKATTLKLCIINPQKLEWVI